MMRPGDERTECERLVDTYWFEKAIDDVLEILDTMGRQDPAQPEDSCLK